MQCRPWNVVFLLCRGMHLQKRIFLCTGGPHSKKVNASKYNIKGNAHFLHIFPSTSCLQRRRKTKRLSQWPDLNAKQRNNKSGMKLLHHTHFGPRMPAFSWIYFYVKITALTLRMQHYIPCSVPFLRVKKQSKLFFFEQNFRL